MKIFRSIFDSMYRPGEKGSLPTNSGTNYCRRKLNLYTKFGANWVFQLRVIRLHTVVEKNHHYFCKHAQLHNKLLYKKDTGFKLLEIKSIIK